MGQISSTYAHIFCVGKPQGNKPRWIPRCKSEDNIKMDLKEIGYGDVDCSGECPGLASSAPPDH
jgi:hypothetical protein